MPALAIVVVVSGILAGVATVAGVDPLEVFFSVTGNMFEGLAVVADGVLDLLPDTGQVIPTIPSGWLAGYATANKVLPLTETLAYLSLVLTVVAAVGAWRLAVTIYHLIPKPFSGT